MSKLLSVVSVAAVLALAGPALAEAPSFEELDQNKDGSLSKEEAAKAPSLDFAKADINRDGRIDRQEYEEAMG